MLVLAVDDDQEDLDLFCEAVAEIDSSIDLITANNGEGAINYLTQHAVMMPDFIFLDINMPKMDGRECLKAIRGNPSIKHIPVIVYSTSLSKSDKSLFETLDARFLTKVSTYDALISTLRDILGILKYENEQVTPIFKTRQTR
jgi:CheY-like chemotaxis protein